jgi:superfamily II DNA/RNA helicase
MPSEIARLADGMLNKPEKVSVTPVSSTAERIAQQVAHVERSAKPAFLAAILKKEPIDRALVFTRTKHGADRVVRGLVKEGIAAEAIHGNKSQGQRERVLRAFRQGQVRTLVATDIAARGIDVDGISHVFNFDVPEVPETYVHRIGRTARAGRTGTAISLCSADERKLLGSIEKLIRSEIAVLGEPPVETARSTAQRAEGDRKQSPAKGKRKRRSGKGQARYNRRGTNDGDLSTMPFLKPAQRGRRVADGRSAGAR